MTDGEAVMCHGTYRAVSIAHGMHEEVYAREGLCMNGGNRC